MAPWCPRCPAGVTNDGSRWTCADHGPVTPLWRPSAAGYDALAEHLTIAAAFPTLLPWPLPPGWSVHDFGCVAAPGADGRASFTACSGATEDDGVVEITVVSEEAGVGLGARCAGVVRSDPGAEIGDGPPHARVRLDGRAVSLWTVSTSDRDVSFDRSVLAGEAQGRWLWLVLRPASAALLMGAEWPLRDIASLGPALVDLPFGYHPPSW